jgi:hypothetical protein
MSHRRNSKLYFERQRGRECSVHAFNNAVQRRALTAKNVRDKIEDVIATKPPRSRDKFRSMLCGDGGYFSPSMVIAAGIDRGYDYENRKISTALRLQNARSKRYYIMGTRRREGWGHAIAIARGHIFDSIEPAPIRMGTRRAREYFIRVYEVSPDIFEIAAPGERIENRRRRPQKRTIELE